MKKVIIYVALAATLLLAACGEQIDQCAQASNPAECRAWTDSGGDVQDYLIGGMVGYMLANRGGQTVVVQDPSYRGPIRRLSRPLPDVRDQIIRKQQAKIQHQKAELRRQQDANRRIRSPPWRTSSSRSSGWSSSRSRSSFRSNRTR